MLGGECHEYKNLKRVYSTKEIKSVITYLLYPVENILFLFHLRALLTLLECCCFIRLYAYYFPWIVSLDPNMIIITPILQMRQCIFEMVHLNTLLRSHRQQEVDRPGNLPTDLCTHPSGLETSSLKHLCNKVR